MRSIELRPGAVLSLVHVVLLCLNRKQSRGSLVAGQTSTVQRKFALTSVQHRPTYGPNAAVSPHTGLAAHPPMDMKLKNIDAGGYNPTYDTTVDFDRRTHIGCFLASMSLSVDQVTGSNYDPNECFDKCQSLNPNRSSYDIVALVHKDQCGCSFAMSDLQPANAVLCKYYCKYYQNPICGGPPNYWGAFREYDYQSLNSHGAFDPLRFIWYTVVVFKHKTLIGGFNHGPDILPERYFLHAVDITNGRAQYQYQMEIAGQLYGLKYDLDNSRLVAMHTSGTTGRMYKPLSVPIPNWEYKLAVITIDTNISTRPTMNMALAKIDLTTSQFNSSHYLAISGASAIISLMNCFIFTQTQFALAKREMKDRLYLVRIPDGYIINQATAEGNLDFKTLQIFANEKYGDITAIGPRRPLATSSGVLPSGKQTYVYIGRLDYDANADKHTFQWSYNPTNPLLMTQTLAVTANLDLYPGVNANEHIDNKTAIVYRRTPTTQPYAGAITVLEVDIRTKTDKIWCNATAAHGCLGTIMYKIPYAGIFNREPGIPLSLKAPEMTLARFTDDAATINVDFDSPTLRMALQVDTNGDNVPDIIDYSTQPTGTFDCGLLFNPQTVFLLGPYDPNSNKATSCLWMSDSRVTINLPPIINVSVGDSLFLKQNTIYALPQGNEYSPASIVGVQVDPPTPIPIPVPVINTPGTTIDSCTGVSLSASSSFFVGGLPTYEWQFVPSTAASPNPNDLTNSPFRTFNQTLIAGIINYTQYATANNFHTFTLASSFFETAATYKFVLNLTSRWLVSAQKPLTITKLSFSAPMVTITGSSPVNTKRPNGITLSAIGTPSGCAGASAKLKYQWVSTDFDFTQYPNIVTAASALSIPAFHLEPPTESVILSTGQSHRSYNFTVECQVDAPGGNDPAKTARATVSVWVTQSTIFVVFAVADRTLTKSDILVLDARESQDPDYPTGSGQTFKGNFYWKCLTPPPRQPCFATPFNQTADGTVYALNPGAVPSPRCRQDVGRKIQDGGKTFNMPLFDGKDYCEYARGVTMWQTNNFIENTYKFETRIQTYQNLRTASKEAMITITNLRVPKVLITITNPQAKYPTTTEIRLQGSEEGNAYPTQPQTKRFYWEIYQYELRSTPSTSSNPNAPSLVDVYVWVNKTHIYNPYDPTKFEYNPDFPTLKIRSGVLLASSKYKVRLNISLSPSGAVGYSEVAIETAGLPPRNGDLVVTPSNATLDVSRDFTADSWTADDLPLSFSFGTMTYTGGVGSKVPLSTAPSVTFTLTVPSLPLGDLNTNYTLYVYVDVITPYQAMTTKIIAIQSSPPSNTSLAQTNMLNQAANANPSNQLNLANNALSLNPTNPNAQNQVVNMIQNSNIPPTPSALAQQSSLLNNVVACGGTGTNVLNAVEQTVVTAADQACVSVNPNSVCSTVANSLFSTLGGLLPGASNSCPGSPAPAPAPAGGRRLMSPAPAPALMRKYRNVNDDFTYRNYDHDSDGTYMMDDKNAWFPLESHMGRKMLNHPPIDPTSGFILECKTAFCDSPGASCVRENYQMEILFFLCCDAANPDSVCNDPPCWFKGQACPRPDAPRTFPLGQLGVSEDDETSNTDQLDTDTWFGQWNAYNFPLEEIDKNSMSDWDRSAAFHGWHPDVYKRRLMYATVDASKSQAQMLQDMEANEKIELATVRQMVENQNKNVTQQVQGAAFQEITFKAMDPSIAATMKANVEQDRIAAANYKLELERNQSQRITRISVMRDTLAKQIISQISKSELRQYTSVSFTLTLGKTTNLSRIHPSFVFPTAFQVPPDSPDFPTPSNNVTGFAFEYVQYVQNIYYWSDSNPASTQSQMVTLIALKASTADLDIKTVTTQPIQIFSDYRLFSNALCLWWDRFAINTAGGKWSTQGVTNDETSCLTTNLSDIGLFMDGRVQGGVALIDAATDWQREVWEKQCVACGDDQNKFVIAVLGMLLFAHLLMILLGYVVDETRRTDMAKQKLHSKYHYDGDGLTGPLNVDDAIAYHLSYNLLLLWLGTLWKVAKREHALLSPAFYHEVFTRPQRMLCFCALSLGLLAMNAIVQSRRGYVISKATPQEYLMSGVLSGLLAFPIYCGFVLMFNMRPMPVKKRLIKRTYNPREVDLIAQKRKELDHTSNLLPPPGYLKLPPPPPGGIPHPPGEAALMGVPSPLKLPPLPPAAPGGTGHLPALPPPPTGPGGVPGIPALPSLPGLPGQQMALPPPPSYPPPPKGAKAPPVHLTLPPTVFKSGPPQRPQIANYPETHHVPANMIANSPYVQSGNASAMALLDDGSMGGTGGTSQRPLPIAADAQMDSTGHYPTNVPALPEPSTPPASAHPLGLEDEVVAAPPSAVLNPEGRHQMMRPSSVGTPGTPAESDFGSASGMVLTTPRGGQLEVPANMKVNTAFIRGQPNQNLPPPFVPGPSGPGGFPMPGLPPIGSKPPPGMPQTFKPPGLPGMPPPPPPPPKEDGDAFIRRIRLTYMDKVIKEHEKYDLLEDHDELGKETPSWVFSATVLMPYLACCTFICSAIFLVLVYGVKFNDEQAERWVLGSTIGLAMVLGLLELFRVLMMTLVELRKFENRKKAKAGHFLPRRVKREDDKHFQEAPKPRLWKNSVAAASVPKGHQNNANNAPVSRPNVLAAPAAAPLGLGGLPPPPAKPGGLALAPPPPPPKASNAGQMDFSRAFGQIGGQRGIEPLQRGFDSGPSTPTRQLSGTGPMGVTPPGPPLGLPSGATPDQTMNRSSSSGLPPMKLGGLPKGPPTAAQSTAGAAPQPVSLPPRGSGSPTNSNPGSNRSGRSLGALRQAQQASLSQQVKAAVQRHDTPPPPPPGAGSRPQSAGSSPAPPPAGPPPAGSRRRPTSGSKASAPGTPAGGPPPAPLPKEPP